MVIRYTILQELISLSRVSSSYHTLAFVSRISFQERNTSSSLWLALLALHGFVWIKEIGIGNGPNNVLLYSYNFIHIFLEKCLLTLLSTKVTKVHREWDRIFSQFEFCIEREYTTHCKASSEKSQQLSPKQRDCRRLTSFYSNDIKKSWVIVK